MLDIALGAMWTFDISWYYGNFSNIFMLEIAEKNMEFYILLLKYNGLLMKGFPNKTVYIASLRKDL